MAPGRRESAFRAAGPPLTEQNFTDLGLPVDGSDSLFLPPELANMFMPSTQTNNSAFQFSLPDSADVGAEAW